MIFRLIFIALLSITTTFASPNIVVSIKPIHSIVSHLTQGVTT
ncbi:MAG TPA: ABC transporter substrate-binding protein, partial [Gammaproteobacteria bacterium]|nr:ABC transporter substrate-binding protein [Gammaproteobacteria bacterium]